MSTGAIPPPGWVGVLAVPPLCAAPPCSRGGWMLASTRRLTRRMTRKACPASRRGGGRRKWINHHKAAGKECHDAQPTRPNSESSSWAKHLVRGCSFGRERERRGGRSAPQPGNVSNHTRMGENTCRAPGALDRKFSLGSREARLVNGFLPTTTRGRCP